MNVQKMSCPNCGAPISVAEDLNQLNCAFCSSTLSVQRGEGYVALKMAEKLGQAIQDSSAQTQGTIREGTQVTQLELKRLQINQDITTAQLQLSNVQAEIRSLEREKVTGKTKQQLRELRQEEASIKSRIASLQAILQPNLSSAGATSGLPGAAPTKSMTWRTGCGWAVLIFFVVGGILGNATSSLSEGAQSVASFLALAAGLGFYFYYRSRKKKHRSRKKKQLEK